MSRTMDAARGKWRGILLQLGVPEQALRDKHGPCPLCGGKDRYRWDNKGGNGTYFCAQCGAGNGMQLLMQIKAWDFPTAARHVDAIVGRVRPEAPPKQRSPEQRLRQSRDLWEGARRLTPGDPVSLYLERRGVGYPQNTDALRFAPACPVPGGSQCTAMIAKVTGPDGRGATIHRTFLTPDGRKAAMDEPRATMPGCIPDGSAIRLAMHGERLGIAEGIETALAATKRFGVPAWAAINATMLAKWQPPEGVREVIVFADNDANYAGLLAAATLAHRLTVRAGLTVAIQMPERVGMDWADAA